MIQIIKIHTSFRKEEGERGSRGRNESTQEYSHEKISYEKERKKQKIKKERKKERKKEAQN